MGTLTKFGREFEFDDDTPSDVQEKRILNWMQKHAPDELKTEKAPEPRREEPSSSKESAPAPKGHNKTLALLASTLMRGLPGGSIIASLPGFRERAGNVDTYRTLAQGAIPYADEATAGVRSLFGSDYDTALAEERQGPKNYEEKYGGLEKTALELLGTVGTLPIGGAAVGALKGVPVAARAGRAMINSPWKSALATGAGAGAFSGFGSGEDGFEDRLNKAGAHGALGAVLGPLAYAGVKGVRKIGDTYNMKNAVADWLRKSISTDRKIDPKSATFTDDAMTNLRRGIREGQNLKTDPMTADLLPSTAEAALQKPGLKTSELSDAILERQYDRKLPEDIAEFKSQRGRAGRAFDQSFGPDVFQKEEADLIKAQSDAAKAAFPAAYQKNIRTPELEDALNDPYVKKAWASAVDMATSQRRAVGPVDALGNVYRYNTEFLHDLKRALDDKIDSALSPLSPAKNEARIYGDAKNRLNKAIMDANPEYAAAMKQFGDDAALRDALRKGREEVFMPGSVDITGGMDGKAIQAYKADPNVTSAQRDLFMVGAARAAREKFLGSQSKKFGHNWADIASQPAMAERLGALLEGNTKLTGWNLLRAKLMKESENYEKLIRGALGNSRTNKRMELMKELEGEYGANPGSIGAAALHPTSAGVWQRAGTMIERKLARGDAKANKAAEILGRKGRAGNKQSLDEIEAMLKNFDNRRSFFDTMGAVAPGVASYSWPYGKEKQ